jgi:hypothetical protein
MGRVRGEAAARISATSACRGRSSPNGFTNTITLHTQPDYIVEPYEDAASKNTPPKIKFEEAGPVFSGPPVAVAAKLTGAVGTPLALTAWVVDEGPKINVPETPAGGRGRGRGRGGEPAAAGGEPAAGRGADAAAGRGGDAAAQGRGRGAGAAARRSSRRPAWR